MQTRSVQKVNLLKMQTHTMSAQNLLEMHDSWFASSQCLLSMQTCVKPTRNADLCRFLVEVSPFQRQLILCDPRADATRKTLFSCGDKLKAKVGHLLEDDPPRSRSKIMKIAGGLSYHC